MNENDPIVLDKLICNIFNKNPLEHKDVISAYEVLMHYVGSNKAGRDIRDNVYSYKNKIRNKFKEKGIDCFSLAVQNGLNYEIFKKNKKIMIECSKILNEENYDKLLQNELSKILCS